MPTDDLAHQILTASLNAEISQHRAICVQTRRSAKTQVFGTFASAGGFRFWVLSESVLNSCQVFADFHSTSQGENGKFQRHIGRIAAE